MTMHARHGVVLAVLAILVATLFVLSLLVGPAKLGIGESLSALFALDGGTSALIMQEIRLPRAALGVLVGATLGLGGAALQGYLRNPLAEPALLGVSAAASFGAVIAFYTGLSLLAPYALPLMGMAGGVLSVIVVLGLAGARGGTLAVVLAGVAVSSLAAALTALALNLSPNPFAALEIVFWMLGSLADRSMADVWLILPFILAGALMLAMTGRALDALTLGEDVAATSGVDLRRTRWLIVIGVAMGTGAATSVTGAIGFVGLVVPHLLRPFVGAMPSRLLPASALGGAAMLLAADILVRLVAPERDLKIGVLTALVGAPFFLALVVRLRRQAP